MENHLNMISDIYRFINLVKYQAHYYYQKVIIEIFNEY